MDDKCKHGIETSTICNQCDDEKAYTILSNNYILHLKDDEVDFLLWCIGYIEGLVTDNKSSRLYVLPKLESMRNKLINL